MSATNRHRDQEVEQSAQALVVVDERDARRRRAPRISTTFTPATNAVAPLTSGVASSQSAERRRGARQHRRGAARRTRVCAADGRHGTTASAASATSTGTIRDRRAGERRCRRRAGRAPHESERDRDEEQCEPRTRTRPAACSPWRAGTHERLRYRARASRHAASSSSQASGRQTSAARRRTAPISQRSSATAAMTVRVVTMGDHQPTERPVPVDWIDLASAPFVVRYPLVAVEGRPPRAARRRRLRDRDVRRCRGCLVARARRSSPSSSRIRPSSARGATAVPPGSLEAVPERRAAARLARSGASRPLARPRAARSSSRAATSPSRAIGWGLDGDRVEVLANPAPPPSRCSPSRSGRGALVFVGRLTRAEGAAGRARRAGTRCRDARARHRRRRPGARAARAAHPDLQVADRVQLRRRRCRATRRSGTSRARSAALSSRARGRTCRTPPSRRSRSGRRSSRRRSAACRRSCTTTRTGCSCRRTTVRALADAIAPCPRRRALRDRLAAGAQPSVAAIGREAIYARLEAILAEAAAETGRASSSSAAAASPFRSAVAREEVGRRSAAQLDFRVLARAGRRETARGRFTAPSPCAALRRRALLRRAPVRHPPGAARRSDPDVIVATDPFVGAAALLARRLARSAAKLDRRGARRPATFTRLYGSPARRRSRRSGRPSLARALAASARTRRARSPRSHRRRRDGRAACPPPRASPPTAISRPSPTRRSRRCPTSRRLVFVGALEAYKNVRGLAAAWRQVAAGCRRRSLIDRRQRLAAVRRRRARARPARAVDTITGAPPPEVAAAALDASRALVLPSWPEGLGRVVLESFARGRTRRRDRRRRHPRHRQARRRRAS